MKPNKIACLLIAAMGQWIYMTPWSGQAVKSEFWLRMIVRASDSDNRLHFGPCFFSLTKLEPTVIRVPL